MTWLTNTVSNASSAKGSTSAFACDRAALVRPVASILSAALSSIPPLQIDADDGPAVARPELERTAGADTNVDGDLAALQVDLLDDRLADARADPPAEGLVVDLRLDVVNLLRARLPHLAVASQRLADLLAADLAHLAERRPLFPAAGDDGAAELLGTSAHVAQPHLAAASWRTAEAGGRESRPPHFFVGGAVGTGGLQRHR